MAILKQFERQAGKIKLLSGSDEGETLEDFDSLP